MDAFVTVFDDWEQELKATFPRIFIATIPATQRMPLVLKLRSSIKYDLEIVTNILPMKRTCKLRDRTTAWRFACPHLW